MPPMFAAGPRRKSYGIAFALIATAVVCASAWDAAASEQAADPARPQDVVIDSQDFEGAFPPAGWYVTDNITDTAQYEWDRETCQVQAGAGGSAAAWALGGGALGSGLTCGSEYTDPVDTSMTFGPIDTTGYPGGLRVSLSVWLDIPALPVGEAFIVCATHGTGPLDFACYGTGLEQSDWVRFEGVNAMEFPLATGRTDNYIWLSYFDRVPEGGHVGVFIDNIVIEGVGGSGVTDTPTPTVSATLTGPATSTPTPTFTDTPTVTQTQAPSNTPLPTAEITATASPTPSDEPSATVSPTASSTLGVSATPTLTPEITVSATATGTVGDTPEPGTSTPTATAQPTTDGTVTATDQVPTGTVTADASAQPTTPSPHYRVYLPMATKPR